MFITSGWLCECGWTVWKWDLEEKEIIKRDWWTWSSLKHIKVTVCINPKTSNNHILEETKEKEKNSLPSYIHSELHMTCTFVVVISAPGTGGLLHWLWFISHLKMKNSNEDWKVCYKLSYVSYTAKNIYCDLESHIFIKSTELWFININRNFPILQKLFLSESRVFLQIV